MRAVNVKVRTICDLFQTYDLKVWPTGHTLNNNTMQILFLSFLYFVGRSEVSKVKSYHNKTLKNQSSLRGGAQLGCY